MLKILNRINHLWTKHSMKYTFMVIIKYVVQTLVDMLDYPPAHQTITKSLGPHTNQQHQPHLLRHEHY